MKPFNVITIVVLIVGAMSISIPSLSSPGDSTARRKSIQYIGFEFGVAKPDMYGTELDLQLSRTGAYFRTKTGFQAGFFFKNEFTKAFYIKTGMTYSERIGQVVNSTFLPNDKIESKYATIPVLTGLQLVGEGKNGVKLGIELGGSISFSSNEDNLTQGLYPGQVIHRPTAIPSLLAACNLEIPLSSRANCFFSYRFSKDLNYYFSRRYTWYDDTQQKYVYKDYDVWMQCSSLTLGVFYDVTN